jgi:hypothetical protein
LWLSLAAALALMAIAAAAVAVPAFVILGPWALCALGLAILLIAGQRGRHLLIASATLGFLSTGLGIVSLLGSSQDFQAGNVVFVLLSAAAAAYSIIGLNRRDISPRLT